MKKKSNIWKIVLAVVVVIVVVAAFGGGKKKDETTPTQTEDKTQNSDPIYHIGDVVKVGDVEYTINSMEAVKTIGSEYINKTAQETFLKINITIKNNGNKALSVSDSFFKLKKGDKEYETDSGSSIYLSEETVIFKSINPDATLTGTFLFDVTQETIDDTTLQLQVQTGAWGTEKGLINLY